VVPFNVITILLLSCIALYAVTALYVIGVVLRPMLMAAISGLMDLAQHAMAARGTQPDVVSKLSCKSVK